MFAEWQLICSKLHKMTIFSVILMILDAVLALELNASSGTNVRNGDYDYQYVTSWPKLNRTLGSVSAVALDRSGNVVILHRGSHVWDRTSFDALNRYNLESQGPIAVPTLLTITPDSGKLIQERGENFFFMPHGLTIDRNNSYWLTDVALHQVFKFDWSVSSREPVMTLGWRFKPGSDTHSFCKPTAVAVLDNGDFFVADGYCNGRVMKFSPEGRLILSWGKNSFALTRTFTLPAGPVPENFFAIPHALTYAADRNLLCVADREQGRIQCFDATDGTFKAMYDNPAIGSRLFSVKYNQLDGGLFYVINGLNPEQPINGFVLSMTSREIVGRFNNDGVDAFRNPHELAVSDDGEYIYVAELQPTKVHKFKRKSSSQHAKQSDVVELAHSGTFPTDSSQQQTGMSDALYASSLTTVSIVISLVATSCLILCISRTICFKTGSRSGRQQFSTPSENISLRNLNRNEESGNDV